MHLCFFQNLSSFNRRHTASFSTSRMNLASHFLNSMMLSSTIDGIDQPPEPIRRPSIVSPASQGDLPHQRPAVGGEEVQLLAQRIHRHLEIFDDRIRLLLL